jgi:hypothetical protein
MSALLIGCLLSLCPASTGTDELTFAEPTVRCGTVYAGAPLAHRFEFQNLTRHVIRITDVHTHCGCTTPRLGQLIYQPGERGTVELEVMTLTQPAGPHTFSAHVEYEVSGAKKEAEVELQAVLVSELMIAPAKLVVPASHVDQHPFTLSESRRTPVHILEVRTSLPQLAARADEPKQDASGGWTRAIHLVVEPGLAPGKHEASLDIYTSDPRYPHLQAPFTVINKAADEISFSPKEIDVRGQAGRPLPSQLVVLRPAPGQSLQIDSITADNPAITARWAANAEGVIAVRVQVDYNQLQGTDWNSVLHIAVGGSKRAKLDIPLHCKLSE